MTEDEKEFWESIPQADDELVKNGVGKYRLTEAELPASMEQNGFVDVTTGSALLAPLAFFTSAIYTLLKKSNHLGTRRI